MLTIIRVTIGLFFLIYASIEDIRSREIKNITWLPLAILGITLLFFIHMDTTIILSIASITVLSLLMAIFKVWGKADSKILFSLGLLIPLWPTLNIFPLYPSPIFFPITIFTNSLIITLAIPLFLCIYNIYKKDIQFPHLFIGYTIQPQDLNTTTMKPLTTDTQDKTWVTPRIPVIPLILIGFICSLIIGDTLYHIISIFL